MAQLVARDLSMVEVRGSKPRESIFAPSEAVKVFLRQRMQRHVYLLAMNRHHQDYHCSIYWRSTSTRLLVNAKHGLSNWPQEHRCPTQDH